MNTNTQQPAQSGSLHPICSACGATFVPWIKSDNVPTRVCLPCGMINLASHCEHAEEGDSLADISDGEQNGMFFRMLADEAKPKPGKWVTTHDGYTEPRFEPNDEMRDRHLEETQPEKVTSK